VAQALLGALLGFEAGFGALLQFLGELAAFVGFDGGDEDAGDAAAFIADRAVGQVEPDLGVALVALQHKALLAEGAHLAAEDRVIDRRGETVQFRPGLVRRLAHRVGVLVARQQGEGVVVELDEFAAPQQLHRHRRVDDDIHGGTQALRPIIGLTEGVFGPVQPRNQCGGFATGGCFLHKKP